MKKRNSQPKAEKPDERQPEPAQSPVRTETTREYLRYDFTPAELAEFARSMARSHQKRSQLEIEAKAVNTQFKSNIEAETNLISDYANKLNNGYEYRNIDCEKRFNDPVIGEMTLIRLDTGEIVKTRLMTLSERQEPLPFANDPLVVEVVD